MGGEERKGRRRELLSLLIRILTLTLSDQGPTPVTSFNLQYLFIPHTATTGVRASMEELKGDEGHNAFSPQWSHFNH